MSSSDDKTAGEEADPGFESLTLDDYRQNDHVHIGCDRQELGIDCHRVRFTEKIGLRLGALAQSGLPGVGRSLSGESTHQFD